MDISIKGLNLIKNFEGFRAKAYNATGFEPYLTIGYGHYGPDVQAGQVVTEAQATDMLHNDLKHYVEAVNRYTNGKANQNQFDALVSFCYNLGTGIFESWGSFNADYVRRNLPLYNKGFGANGTLVVLEGLNNRRKAELILFNDGNVVPGNGSTGQIATKGVLEMFLIFCIDSERWYICNGPEVKYLSTKRMLDGFLGKFGGITAVPTHRMKQAEFEKEYGKK